MIAIDLGSNTCRFLHVKCDPFEILGSFEVIVKTADQLHSSGIINDAALSRVIGAIQRASEMMPLSSETVVAVTTEAMRQAKNRDAVLAQIEAETGIRFDVINASHEARATTRAVRYRLEELRFGHDSLVMIDIGGGSTEVAFMFEGALISRSFPVGIVTLSQQCDSLEAVHAWLETGLDNVRTYVDEIYSRFGKPDILVPTAGTPTTIAAYLQGMDYASYDVERINGFVLTCKDIRKALDALMALDEAERSRYVGVGRESLIAAGIVLVEAMYELLGFESGVVVDDGLREGVALEYCESLK